MYVNNTEPSLRVKTNLRGATNLLTSVRHFYSGFLRKRPALEISALPTKPKCFVLCQTNTLKTYRSIPSGACTKRTTNGNLGTWVIKYTYSRVGYTRSCKKDLSLSIHKGCCFLNHLSTELTRKIDHRNSRNKAMENHPHLANIDSTLGTSSATFSTTVHLREAISFI